MIKNLNVVITIQDTKTGVYYVIPVTPAKISYGEGNKKVETVDVLNLGDVNFPTGVELDSISWDSFFPVRYDSSYCATKDIRYPGYWRDMFRQWKIAGTPLQLVCPASRINTTVYVESFPWTFGEDAEGDIRYSLTFRQYKTVAPRQITIDQPAVSPYDKGYGDRASVPSSSPSGTYTVKSGDCLTWIAKNMGLSDWRNQLYEPNRDVIGSNPNLIYPGQVLRYGS